MTTQPFAWSLAALAALAVVPYLRAPSPAPAAGDEAALKAMKEGLTDKAGKVTMKAVEGLTADDMTALVKYVRTLKK